MKQFLRVLALGLAALMLTLALSACGGGKEWTDVYSKQQGATEQQDGSDIAIIGDGENQETIDNAPNKEDNDTPNDTVDNSADSKKEQSGSWLDWPIWIWNWFDNDDDTTSSSTSSKKVTVTTSTPAPTVTSKPEESTVTSSEEEKVDAPSSKPVTTTSTTPTVTSKEETSSSQQPTTTSNDGWTGDYIINTKPRK